MQEAGCRTHSADAWALSVITKVPVAMASKTRLLSAGRLGGTVSSRTIDVEEYRAGRSP